MLRIQWYIYGLQNVSGLNVLQEHRREKYFKLPVPIICIIVLISSQISIIGLHKKMNSKQRL